MAEVEKFEDGEASSVATGEFGFCRNCGEARPVLMPGGDRLQARLRRAFDQLAKRDGQDVEEFAEQLMEAGVAEIRQFGLLDHPVPARLEVGLVAMMQALILVERHLERRLDRPIDLLRLATERIESELEQDKE